MAYIVLADPQDITRAGLMYLCEKLEVNYQQAPDKTELIEQLFVHRAIAIGPQFSVLLKDSPLAEIRECIRYAMTHQRYICQRMAEILLAPVVQSSDELKLTKTETEILKDIALGMTTREIADKRFSSFHTVNTHRKNIFRKLGVNNAHEATKYALRAGLVDSAEYYI